MQIVSEYIALLQDDVDPKNATEERHCCWQIEEVSGFVAPKNEVIKPQLNKENQQFRTE